MYGSAERRDYAAAIYYADVLLGTRPQLGSEVVIPILARIAEDKEAVVAFKEMLSRDPPWRAQFFDALPGSRTSTAASPRSRTERPGSAVAEHKERVL